MISIFIYGRWPALGGPKILDGYPEIVDLLSQL